MFYYLDSLTSKFPKVDVSDNDDDITLLAELPGVRKDDVDVKVDNRTLTIKGTKKEIVSNSDYKECYYGEFERSFTIPDSIDTEGINAKLENGVLKLVLRKNKRSLLKIDIK